MIATIATTANDLLTSAGYHVGCNAKADNPNVVSINSSNHEAVESAAAWLVELLDGDMEIIETVVNNEDRKVIFLEMM